MKYSMVCLFILSFCFSCNYSREKNISDSDSYYHFVFHAIIQEKKIFLILTIINLLQFLLFKV